MMLKLFGLSEVVVVTPPASEDGENRCPTSKPIVDATIVNNAANQHQPILVSPIPPPSPPTSIKSRRDRSSLQREANRSRQFTTRQQRSATTNSIDLPRQRPKPFQRPSSAPQESGLKALEPLHEQNLTKMAFAEQQKWITVQQKTFTKW